MPDISSLLILFHNYYHSLYWILQVKPGYWSGCEIGNPTWVIWTEIGFQDGKKTIVRGTAAMKFSLLEI
jgi:hypothetical protein